MSYGMNAINDSNLKSIKVDVIGKYKFSFMVKKI